MLECLFFPVVFAYLVGFVLLFGFGRFRVRWATFLFCVCFLLLFVFTFLLFVLCLFWLFFFVLFCFSRFGRFRFR